MFNFRDEKVVSRAIELNEQLQKVLARHDALLSAKPTSTVNHFNQEEVEEEEEAEQLFRRSVPSSIHWHKYTNPIIKGTKSHFYRSAAFLLVPNPKLRQRQKMHPRKLNEAFVIEIYDCKSGQVTKRKSMCAA